jgi:hypothetical protein
MSCLSARRLATTVLVVLSLLFSQLALANYLCPSGQAEPQAGMAMAPGQPCEAMAAEQAAVVLCHQHCSDAPQRADPVQPPAISLPAVLQVLVLAPAVDPVAGQSAAFTHAREAQPPPAPIFLSTLRLRV